MGERQTGAAIILAALTAGVLAAVAAQGPPVRFDFEGRLAKPAGRPALGTTTPGAPVRVDFEGRLAKPTAGGSSAKPLAAGPSVRFDFEGRLSRAKPGSGSAPSPGGLPIPDRKLPPPQAEVAPTITITGFEPAQCVPPGANFVLVGRGFGQAPGNRRVLLKSGGAFIPLKVAQWSDGRIFLTLPRDQRIAAGQSYAVGLESPPAANTPISLAASTTVRICRQ